MNEGPDLDGDALRELLERRARRVGTEGQLAAIRSAAAATPQWRPGRLGFVHGLAAGAAGVASLGVLVVVLAVAAGWRVPLSPIGATASGAVPSSEPTSGPSSGPPATPVIPGAAEAVMPLTVDQLNSILLPNSKALLGRLLVITGTIDDDPPSGCCPPASSASQELLVGSVPRIRVVIAAAASLPDRTPWTGAFAARMVDTRTIEYLEPVTLAPGGEPMTPSHLSSLSALTRSSGYVLVQGWIAGLEADLPCPLASGSSPSGPQYGCGRTASLSDTNSQPVSDLQLKVPDDGVQVQNHAYDDFAPDPQSSGYTSLPERATFLLDQALLPCPSDTYCTMFSTGFHWNIAARIDPWPAPSQADLPTPGPRSSPAAAQPVQPLTVAQLNAYMAMNSQSPEGRQLVITGTIEPLTPLPSCIGPLQGCPPLILEGSNPQLRFGPMDGRESLAPVIGRPSTFAATLHGFTLSYVGSVSTAADGVGWLPSQLPNPSVSGAGDGYWLAQGWIWSAALDPACGVLLVTPYPGYSGPDYYGCGRIATLGDSAYDAQIYLDGGSLPHTLRVQNGAYQIFASDPNPNKGDYAPERATFLLQAIHVPACGPTADCFIPPSNYHWAIVARLDPWPVPALP